MPDEYEEFIICDRFHKLPSEIDREPARNIYRLLVCIAVEADVAKARREQGV